MADNIQFNENPDPNDFAIRIKQMDLEAGTLGRFFGSAKSAPLYIAGLVLLLLVLLGCSLYIFASSLAAEYWKTIIPVITGIFGFLFGRNSQ